MNILFRIILSCVLISGCYLQCNATPGKTPDSYDAIPDAVEFAALKSLYDELGGNLWFKKPNWPAAGSWPSFASSAQFANWHGITVANGDIVKIELSINNLQGTIPSNLGNLTKLTDLNLSENKLSGSIPNSFSSLINLKTLRLGKNELSGVIPPQIGQLINLTTLSLGRNQLSGVIPESIGYLKQLTTLSLSENQLSGTIPLSVCELRKVQTLALNNNRLSGCIPAQIGKMIELRSINLTINQLTGEIPSSLGDLKLINFVNFSKNQLTGSIPKSIGGMTFLADLYIHENHLTDSLPGELGNLERLRTFDAHGNRLTGNVPYSFRNLSRMEDFYLNDNLLEGQLPQQLLTSWANLTIFDVSGNQFTGSFPSLSSKNKLVHLRADRNAFKQLPADILTLPVLTSLSLKENSITEIPAFCNHTNKANLTVALQSNFLDYSSLQTLKCAGLKSATFAPQRAIADIKSIPAHIGTPLIIPCRPLGPATTYVHWEKQLANGNWQNIDHLNEETSSQGFKRNTMGTTDEGIYRWRMNNTVITELTLESEPITVKTASRSILDNLVFQYKYDNRNRVTHKKAPGTDWVYLVYDKRDRVVLSQDGEERKTNGWKFTKYDGLNRPIMTGIYHHSVMLDQAEMSSLLTTGNLFETYNGQVNHHGYTNTMFPPTTFSPDSFDISTVTYYDNYDFKTGWASAFNYDSARIPAQTQFGAVYKQPRTEYKMANGFVTGKKIKTTGSDPYWLYAVQYYDETGRLIQEISENYKGGVDRVTKLYDFVGKVLASTTEHTINTLTWQNLVGVRVEVDNLVRFATNNTWGTAGAASAQIIPANTDGWAETTATSTSTFRMIGVSAQDGNQHYSTMDYAFYLRGKDLAIYEKTKGINNIYLVPGGLTRGDKLRIERRNNQLRFYRNGIQVYPLNGAGLACTTPLLTDMAFATQRGSLNHTRMSVTQGKPQTIAREFKYDHAGRLLQVWHTTNTSPKVLLVSNAYNSLGQLITKKLHSENAGGTFKQVEDIRYNIRGWLSRINNSDLTAEQANDPQDLFGMNLSYNEVVPTLSNSPQFNGNISAMTWNNGTAQGDAKQNGYRYTYDAMDRIENADFRQKKSGWAQPTHLDDEGDPQSSDAYSENGYKYDLNGNLKRLVRKGAKGLNMDELTYTYGAAGGQESNRLLRVTDAGDKHQGFNDGSTVGDDYAYDNNGSMVVDKNKNISAITYNHLNLPIKVVKNTGEYIRYIYDADGRKHSQQVYDATNALTKRSDYAGELFYENDTLRFINHEEGRIVMASTTPEYQYHLKDHLGNVRVTFTSKVETETAIATLEDANAATERGQFLNYDEAVTLNEPLFDHTHHVPGNAGNTTFRSTRLLGGSDSTAIYGLAKSFSVMPGDTITARVYAKYVDTSDPQVEQALRALLASLGTGNNGGPLVDGGGPGSLGGGIFPFTTYFNHEDEEGDGPKAYLNYLIYDRDFNYLNGGFKRLTANGKETGAQAGSPRPNGGFDVLTFNESDIKITEPGFVYIYLTNENENRVEVFFDDFEVTHKKSPVVQQNDYYPFGLISRHAQRYNSPFNRFLYNGGSELIRDLNLDYYYTKFRTYDYAIGRFSQVDPLVDDLYQWSPYNYSYNNPIRFNDPDGDCPKCKEFLSGVKEGYTSYFSGAWNAITNPGTTLAAMYTPEGAYSALVLNNPVVTPYKQAYQFYSNLATGNFKEAGKVGGEKLAENTVIVATDGAVRGLKVVAPKLVVIDLPLQDSPQKLSNKQVLGPNDPPQRIQGPWTTRDLTRATNGQGPVDFIPRQNRAGKDMPLEIHHADQMPGSAIHEVQPAHTKDVSHPNGKRSQGVTDVMRREDAQLHWQLRGQEMGNPPPF